MNTPEELLYTSSDEWLRRDQDGDGSATFTIGITDYAQDALGEIVYLELPAVGDRVTVGAPFGVAESVKAVGELNAPIAGEVIAINEAAVDAPAMVNGSPYDQGWLIQLRAEGEPDTSGLLDAAAYAAQHS